MSRDQYQVPSSQSLGPSGGGGAPRVSFVPDMGSEGTGGLMQYNCGDCGIKTSLRRSDPIRCKECGCRVLYKERTKRMVQFEAR